MTNTEDVMEYVFGESAGDEPNNAAQRCRRADELDVFLHRDAFTYRDRAIARGRYYLSLHFVSNPVLNLLRVRDCWLQSKYTAAAHFWPLCRASICNEIILWPAL